MSPLVKTGARNSLADVPGLTVGAAQDTRQRTGVSVILSTEDGFRASVERRGGAPGSRETDALAPGTLIEKVHAIALSGGSAFGLDAASGVQSWLAARGKGYHVHGATVPIVPAAIIFDLANQGDKTWLKGGAPPYRDLAKQACDAASDAIEFGNVGAGYGAVAGPFKGGLGGASAMDPIDGYFVGAHMVVNSYGSPVTPDGASLWAAPFELAEEFGDTPLTLEKTFGRWTTKQDLVPSPDSPSPLTNTTIGVAATNAPLTQDQLARFATMAADGLSRAIRPVHTAFDGDLIFALATGDLSHSTETISPEQLTNLGTLAADTVARAIGRAMIEAKDLPPYRSFRPGACQK